jgi:hypothetical protein
MSNTIEFIMQQINGASFIGLDTTTVPTLAGGKKNPMQGRIKKHNVGASVMVFQNKFQNGYENMVRRHLESEGKEANDFQLSPRKWGERIPGLPIVAHKGNRYLEVIFLKPGISSYTLDGEPINKDDIIGLKTSEEGAQGGLSDDNKVHIRTFLMSSIDRLQVNGVSYTNIN